MRGPFERFDVLLKKSYRIASPRLSVRMYENVKNMKSALDSAQRHGREVRRSAVGASILKERKCVKVGGRYLVPSGVCF